MTEVDVLDPLLAAKTVIALWLHDTNGDVAGLGAEVSLITEALTPGSVESVADLLAALGLRAERLADRQRAINDLVAWLWWPHRAQPLVPLDLNQVVQRWRALSPRLARDVRLELADGLPCVRGAAPAIVSILDNMVGNARKYADGPDGGISIRTGEDGGGIVLECRDAGPGFDPDDLVRLFELGYRGARSATRAEGAGTGLAGCALLATRMGATVSARNAEPHGALVTLRLPLWVGRPTP